GVVVHERMVTAVAFDPDGSRFLTATGSPDNFAIPRFNGPGEVHLVDSRSGRVGGGPIRDDHSIYVVPFAPDGRAVLTGGRGPHPRLFEAGEGCRLAWRREHGHWVVGAAFHPGGRTIVSRDAGGTEARFWEASSGRSTGSLRLGGGVPAVVLSPDGRTV